MPMRYLADENFHAGIVRGVRRRVPEIDIVFARDVGLDGRDDTVLLNWAAREDRVILTHDVNTMVGLAMDRVRNGLPMRGLLVAPADAPIGPIIESVILIDQCSLENEWSGQVLFLPL